MAVFLRGWLPHRGKAQIACNFFSAKLLANGHESPRFSEWARTAANRQDSAAFAQHTSIPHDMCALCITYMSHYIAHT